MDERALKPRHAAELIGCSEAALRAWKRQGRGPRYFTAGKLVRYRREDVEAWITERLRGGNLSE